MRPRSSMRIDLDPRYSLLTAAYLAAIQWLSSLPDLGTDGDGPLVRLVMNLGHAPLFAGLAFCVVKSLRTAGESWARYALALAVSTACAALDEWHQSFVPGRHSSIGDLLLDLAGIGVMLLFLGLGTRARHQGGSHVRRGVLPRRGQLLRHDGRA